VSPSLAQGGTARFEPKHYWCAACDFPVHHTTVADHLASEAHAEKELAYRERVASGEVTPGGGPTVAQ
jgi:hypothetical protein